MQNIEQFVKQIHNAYKLKFTYRYTDRTFNGEKDSTAAHSWNMMILADFFLNYLEEQSPGKYNLDKLKIYEYIMYHDLVEAEVGDIDRAPSGNEMRKTKDELEAEGAITLSQKLPVFLGKKFLDTFHDYEIRETPESKFVKIIDVFEGDIQCFPFKHMYKQWSEDFYDKVRFRKEFNDFPELKKVMTELKTYYIQNGYLNQK